jgi:hypothetical protein
MAKVNGNPVRVRIPEGECATVRQKALKCGAVSVSSRTVSPGLTESTAEFSQKKAIKMFLEWLQQHKKYQIVNEECSNGV